MRRVPAGRVIDAIDHVEFVRVKVVKTVSVRQTTWRAVSPVTGVVFVIYVTAPSPFFPQNVSGVTFTVSFVTGSCASIPGVPLASNDASLTSVDMVIYKK